MDINVLGGIPQASVPARSQNAEVAATAGNAAAPASAQFEQAASGNDQPGQARAPVEEAVSSIKQFAQSIQRNLNFALDDSTGRVVVKVTDGASGELIRQIPSEDALRLAESLEEARSLLFEAKA